MTYDPATYWKDRYDTHGATYVARGNEGQIARQQVQSVAPYFRYLPRSGRVLDFGCGPYRFRPHLERHGLEYVGVDIIPGLGTHDLSELEPASFDAAVAIYVLQHIVTEQNYVAAVTKIYELLKDGGRLLVVDHGPTPGMDEHMFPRGFTVLKSRGWSNAEIVGQVNGHWVGIFDK